MSTDQSDMLVQRKGFHIVALSDLKHHAVLPGSAAGLVQVVDLDHLAPIHILVSQARGCGVHLQHLSLSENAVGWGNWDSFGYPVKHNHIVDCVLRDNLHHLV